MTKYKVINPKTNSILSIVLDKYEGFDYIKNLHIEIFAKHGDADLEIYNKINTCVNKISSDLVDGKITEEQAEEEMKAMESSEDYITYNKIMNDILFQGVNLCYFEKFEDLKF